MVEAEQGDFCYWRVLGPEEEVGPELLNAFRGLRKRERVSCTETCNQGLLQVG